MVNVHEAKTHLSRLLAKVEAGEEIIIGRAGRPVACLVPYDRPREPRRPGQLKGQLWWADDFDDTPAGLADLFEGAGDDKSRA